MVQDQNAVVGIALLGFSGQLLAVREGKRVVQDQHVKISILDTLINFVFGSRGDHFIAGVAKNLTLHGKDGIGVAGA